MADEALRRFPDGAIRVISEEYWPLPWYFRGLKRVGYWTRPPQDCDAALVVASADLADAVRSRLHGAYSVSYLGLRPGFACIVFSRTP
jgi:predicted membrane-bound mannosyltransferase